MADQRLNIIFSGDGGSLSKTINELESDLKGFEQELKKTNNTDAFRGISGKIAETTARITQLKGATQSFSSSMKTVASGSQSATFALTNLGRVAQDLPFGFLGIANNLNPLLESFQRLKAETGSTGKAFKALGSSLLGAGGAGFALSVVSSLLLVFGDRIFGAGKKAGESAREIKSAFEVISDSTDSVQGEIAKVNALVNAATDTGNSFKVQANAISELQRINKSYFGELKAGVSSYNDITAAANGYTQALITQAIVEGLKEEISALSKELRVATKEYNALTPVADKARKEMVAAEAAVSNNSKAFSGQNTQLLTASTRYKALNERLGNSAKKVGELTTNFNELTAEIQKQVGISLKLKPLETDDVLSRARQFVKEFGDSFVLPDLSDSFFKTEKELKTASQNLLDNVKRFIEGDVSALKIKLPVEVETSQITQTITKDVEKLNQLIRSLKPLKLTTEGDFKEVQKQLEGLDNKEISIKIDQKGDLSKIAEQLKNLKGVEVPVVIEQNGDIKKIVEQLKSLKPVDIKITGDAERVLTDLSKIKDVSVNVKLNAEDALRKLDSLDKAITIEVNQKGDLLTIAKELTDLKGVTIPVVIEQKGEIQKIADQLKSLKSVDLTITGNVKDVLSDLSKISDIKFKEQTLPIIVNEGGIITQITRAVDGAIKVVQTKEIRIPVVTDAEIKILENITKEVELSKDIIDGFFKSIGKEREIPITIIPDISLSKGNLDKIEEKLKLRKGFSIFGDFGFKEFDKIDFSNINAGIAEATKSLQNMMDVANTLNQAIGQGLVNAFDAAFDAVLEGKSVFKALGEAVKQLVVGTIKAVAQMLILKAVTSIIFPGGGAIPLPFGGRGGVSAPSFGGGVGGLRMAVEFTGQLTGRGTDLYGTVQQGQAQIGRVR